MFSEVQELNSNSLLTVENLVKHFALHSSFIERIQEHKKLEVHAVDGVTFTIGKNETLGLVGESGSGKTTVGRTVLMLERPTSGNVVFDGELISELKGEQLRRIRKKMQIVFQNPNSSLDPRARVRDIISEPLRANKRISEKEIEESVQLVIAAVNLSEDSLNRFPHEFSGGQRQRIAIARSLVINPKFIVLDEPTSALDSSVQAQILNLLQKIQLDLKISYLFITHNVNVVKYMADRIAVMYSGKLVETGSVREVLEHPLHPYTSALIMAVPQPDPENRTKFVPLRGEVPSAISPPNGCRFNPRCPYAEDICRREEPELREMMPGHWSACHFSEKFLAEPEGNMGHKGLANF